LIYRNINTGHFIDRPNRFIAHVEIDGKTETVHVKNTGRCKELLIPGAEVVLSKLDNPKRKTKYDLIAVYKEKLGLVNIDSQAPNHVVQEWLEELSFDLVKPEYTYDKSRIDFYMEKGKRRFLLEVKGCTLEINGMWYIFPQIRGLGMTPISDNYSIRSLREAKDYLKDPVLGVRLVEISKALLELNTSDPHAVFGSPDDLKLRSCMTLFERVDPQNPVFGDVLDKYYRGERDQRTLEILDEE